MQFFFNIKTNLNQNIILEHNESHKIDVAKFLIFIKITRLQIFSHL